MKNAENVRKLLHTMNDFAIAYDCLRNAIDSYEQETGASVNDLPGFTEKYPFDKSFDELAVDWWVNNVIDKVRQSAFKVLDYEYLNTGGNCMVGIFEVWLPEKKQTVYVFVNEEGYTMSLVDYIRHYFEADDYDELMIESGDWGRVTGHETYFELYRYCLNEYTKSDCEHFKYTRELPFHLLSDELLSQITSDYKQWLETNEYDSVKTDGKRIIESDCYEPITAEQEWLNAIKAFKCWHDTTAGVEDLYREEYKLSFAGHHITLPYNADVWDAVDTLLDRTIEEW